MSYCPLTEEDNALRLRMSPGVRASYSLAEIGDWMTTRIAVEPGRMHTDCSTAYRATVGLPDPIRHAVAMWAMARTNARDAEAVLDQAEEALA